MKKRPPNKLTSEQRDRYRRAHLEEEAHADQTKDQAREMFASIDKIDRVVAMLVQARHDAGLTVEEVARRMGAARSNISRLESTDKTSGNPTLKTLAAYASAVDVQLRVSVAKPKGRGAA